MHWLRTRIRLWSRRQRRRMRRWLERHPRLAAVLERAGCLHVDEFALARGVAVGLGIGLTPTLGVQTALMLLASLLLRANFPAAFLASFVNNPITVAPLYFGMNRLGQLLLDRPIAEQTSADDLQEEIADEAAALMVGSLAIAVPAAIVGYLLFLFVWRRLHLHLPRPVDADGEVAGDAADDPRL